MCPVYTGRVRREHTRLCVAIGVRRTRIGIGRPGVTELPGLTSDPIYTADRRGGILISSGPDCMPERVLNPSCRHPMVRDGRGRRSPTGPRLHSIPNALVHIRASDRPPAVSDAGRPVALHPEYPGTYKGIGRRPRPDGSRSPRRVVSESMGRNVLSPSKEISHVMRLHTSGNCRVAGGRPVIPPSVGSVGPGESHASRCRPPRVLYCRAPAVLGTVACVPGQQIPGAVARQHLCKKRVQLATRSRRGARRPASRRCPS
jgi:hypothetical protein